MAAATITQPKPAPELEVDFRRLHRLAREALVERFKATEGEGSGRLLLFAGSEEAMRNETDHEDIFRQESSFHYLFGVREPGFSAVIDVEDGTTTLFAPRLKPEYAIWMGKLKRLEEIRDDHGVDAVVYADELADYMTKRAPERIYVQRGKNADSGREAVPATFPGMGDVCPVDEEVLHSVLYESRCFKNEEELKLLRYVNRVSANAHITMMQQTRPGLMEYQLESTFAHSCYYSAGARLMSYTPIAGSGLNSAILHYGHAGAPNDKQLEDGDMVLCDMGAELHCYASDITNSFPANGRFTEDQRLIFEVVGAMQTAVLEAMGPGVLWADMQTLAYRVLCERLTDAGLLVGDVEDMMAANVAAILMPHGLGHFLGIDTHDVGGYPQGAKRDERMGYKALRLQRTLEPGMVLTVEPGIYFGAYALECAKADEVVSPFFVWDVIDERFANFGGVRLEDNVIVTKDGIEDITVAPRTVEEVEAIMRGDISDAEGLESARLEAVAENA